MSFKDVDRLVGVFVPLCPQQCCLPYLEKGGLRQDLVVKCKAWIVALLSLDSQLRFKWTTVVKAAGGGGEGRVEEVSAIYSSIAVRTPGG